MRRTPLQQGGKPLRRTGIKRGVAKLTTKREKPVRADVRAIVRERSKGMCERCSNPGHRCPALAMHHRVTKARGRFDHPSNLADLCAGPGTCDCHGVVHRLGEFPWLLPGRFVLNKASGRRFYEGEYEPFRMAFGRRDNDQGAAA
jgi:hypothetical protein